jgi:hypothetical protein
MARSRQKTKETDTSCNPAGFDPSMQPQAAGTVQQVAGSAGKSSRKPVGVG